MLMPSKSDKKVLQQRGKPQVPTPPTDLERSRAPICLNSIRQCNFERALLIIHENQHDHQKHK